VGQGKGATQARQVLGLPVAEVARELGMNRSVIFRLEQSDGRGTISLRAMARAAKATDCKMVYAVISRDGKTLEEMADGRRWKKLLAGRME